MQTHHQVDSHVLPCKKRSGYSSRMLCAVTAVTDVNALLVRTAPIAIRAGISAPADRDTVWLLVSAGEPADGTCPLASGCAAAGPAATGDTVAQDIGPVPGRDGAMAITAACCAASTVDRGRVCRRRTCCIIVGYAALSSTSRLGSPIAASARPPYAPSPAADAAREASALPSELLCGLDLPRASLHMRLAVL